MVIDESLDDLSLVKAAQAGELDAENALLMRYKHKAQLICSKYFIPGGDKEDLEQEAMIGLFEAIHAYKEVFHASFWAFASMCIHREVITAIKTANRKKKTFLNNYVSLNEQAFLDSNKTLSEIIPDPESNPEAQFIKMEEHATTMSIAEEKLSAYQLQILKLFLQGYTHTEVANLLNCTPKIVSNNLYRIRKKMADLYTEKHL